MGLRTVKTQQLHPDMGQHRHGKDLVQTRGELHKRQDLTRPDVDHPHATDTLGQPGDGQAAEGCAFAHFGQAHKGQVAVHVQPRVKPGRLATCTT